MDSRRALNEQGAVTELPADVDPEPPTVPAATKEEAVIPAAELAPVQDETPVAEAEEPAPAAEEEGAVQTEEPAPAVEEEAVLAAEAGTTQPEVAQEASVDEFEIECTKKTADDKLGLDILVTEKKVMVVTGLQSGGMIERWNAANPAKKVKRGALIYDINGVSDGLGPMMAEVAKSNTLKLKVRRRNRYTVTVQKKKLLGLDLKRGSLTVTKLTTTASKFSTVNAEDLSLHNWNISCPEGLEIMEGDELVELNGKQVSVQDLQQNILESTGELRLTFVRP